MDTTRRNNNKALNNKPLNNNLKSSNTNSKSNTNANNKTMNNKGSGSVGVATNNPTMRNTLSKTVETGRQNPVLVFIIILVVIILLYVLGNYIYDFYKSSNSVKILKESLLEGINDARNEYEVGSAKMPNSTYSNEYSLSYWMYVDDYSYRQGQRKFIARRGDLKSEVNPEIYLHPNHNTLQINVSLMTDSKGNSQPHRNIDASAHAHTPTPTTTMAEIPATTMAGPPATTAAAVVEGFTCGCDQVKTSEDVLKDINNNNPNIPDNYNNNIFDLISGNEIVKENTHNKLLNNVVEQFVDETSNSSTANCECDPQENDTVSEADRLAFEEKCGKCLVEDFPLQKWVHVVVSQYNQVLDVYLDGKLRSSCMMPGFPTLTQANLVLSPEDGFSGQMTGVSYYNTSLGADEVYAIYKDGPQGSTSILSMIPMWGYVIIVLLIIGIIGYSFSA